MSHLNCLLVAFPTIFCPIKTDLSGNTVWPQASGFQKLAKMDHFWAFIINVNVARFARNVEWDFFCDFQTLWVGQKVQSKFQHQYCIADPKSFHYFSGSEVKPWTTSDASISLPKPPTNFFVLCLLVAVADAWASTSSSSQLWLQ